MYFYAQLDESNICIGVSQLSGEVSEYNYIEATNFDPITGQTTTIERFVSRMISIPVYSENYIGLRYTEQEWEVVSDELSE